MVVNMNSKNCNAMKKIFTKMMLWAVAATALVSCENNFNDTTVNGDTNLVKVTLTADKPTVVSVNRTELNNEGQPLWSVDDQIGVYTAQEKDADIYPFTNDNETEATATTTFTGNTALANTLYVYYPCGDKILAGGARGTISATQQPTATSFDGASDIMIAKPVTLDEAGNQLSNLEFARLGAIVKVVLKDKTGNLANQHLSTLTMTAASNLAGYVYLDVVNQALGELYANESQSVTANYTPATTYEIDGTNATYIVVYPQTLASGSKLTFEAATEGYTITKEITLSQDINLAMGKVTTLNVSLDATNVEEIETIEWVNNAYNLVPNITGLAVGDKVVIVAAGYDKAMGAQTNNNRSAVAVTKNANGTNPTVDITNDVAILNVEAGNVDGTFAFKTSDNKYLYAASSGSNYLRSEATLSDNSSFLVTITDGIASVTAQGENTRNLMRYNNSSTCFSCYGGGQEDICIYKLVGEYVVKAPAITLSVANVTINADITSGEATVTATNGDGWAITATTDDTWVSDLAYADGKITFTATVNESETESRVATVTVTATKADYEDVTTTFTITQNKKQAAGEVVEPVTATLSFANKAQRTAFSTTSQTWEQNGIKLVNDKAASTTNVADYANPVRLYANSKVTITAPGKITKIVFDTNGTSYPAIVQNSIGTTSGASFTTSSDKITVEYSTPVESVVIAKLTAQLKLDSITVTYGGSSEGGDTPETPAPVLAVTSATTIEVAAAGDVPTITYSITNPVEGKSVTASANQTWVNEFDYTVAGEVSFLVDANTGAAREATVTLSYEGAESQTVTISQAAGNTGGGDEPATKVWTLVTDASTLKAGDQIVIASNTKGFTAGEITSQYMGQVSSTFSTDKTTITSLGSGTVILTLGGSAGAWTLTNESGKKLGATAAKKLAWDSGTTTWAITISDNNATIQNGTSTYGRFLHNVSATRFIPYTSEANVSMLLPQIYRLQ